MYFKSVEIAGFKSFVDETKIAFDPGVTAIVGPNGCGKSNISDAIRWVLGEQRPKLLRGAKMDDFLFNGSAGRRPTGMAEVSITVSDLAGKISKPELAGFDEITVTRRLHRDGESEYLINKAQCRLKDVVDLFLDTGISTRAFSIIEQDQVQRIVASKPEERRFIIEEAAGIMKYKHRRQDAQNKLENSKTNLERVSDIIGELEKQRNSLKRQASKAEKYKSLKSEMTGLVLAVSANDYKGLKDSSAVLKAEAVRLEEVRASIEADVATRSNDRTTMQTDLNTAGEEMAAIKEEEYRLGGSIERDQGKLNLFAAQILEIGRTGERLSAEAGNLNRALEILRADAVEKESAVANITSQVEAKSAELARKKEELSSAQAGVDAISVEITTSERELANVAGQSAGASASLAGHKSRVEMVTARLERLNAEIREAQGQLSSAEALKVEKLAALSETQTGFAKIQSRLAELGQQRAELAGRKAEKEAEISALKTTVTQTQARLESLREIDSANEGYQDGARFLLGLKGSDNETARELKGALAERIKASPKVEKALEAALGEKLQALLVKNSNDAISAINLLKRDKAGRGTFATVEGDGPNLHPSWNGLITADAETTPLVGRLLAGVAFVETIESAVRLHAETGVACVTADGDTVGKDGIISGGSPNAAGGILERKRLIGELSDQAGAVLAKLETANTEHAGIVGEDAGVAEEQAVTAKNLKDEELRLVHDRKDIEAIDSEIKRQSSRLETYNTESSAMGLERESMESEMASLASRLENLNRQKAELEAEIQSARARQEEAREAIKNSRDVVSSAEVGLTQLKGELNMATADRERLGRQITASVERVESINREMESGVQKAGELEAETASLKEAIHSAVERRMEVADKIRVVSEKIEGMRGDLSALEEGLKNSSASLESVRESLNTARMRHSETTIRLETLLERANENGLSPDDLAAFDLSSTNIEECKLRLADVREQTTKIGDVNLEAIEEFRQVEERLNFLTAQRDDLYRSIDDINKVIEKINRTTRSLFDETFVLVRDNFKEIFAKLFNGGEADMVLTDEANSLDSGIEIIARPPGKRRQSLTLMSAGEKAMTAVAVLFSVFRVKPSPFCLLDEVDAPLDDANIGRFKDMLSEFTEHTQFLVITHNQKTMAFADRLYGITMQEPGVSTVLSVDLVDTDDSSRERLQVVHA